MQSSGRDSCDQSQPGCGRSGVDHRDPLSPLLLGEHPGCQARAVVHAAPSGRDGEAEDLVGPAAAIGLQELPGRRGRRLGGLAAPQPRVELAQLLGAPGIDLLIADPDRKIDHTDRAGQLGRHQGAAAGHQGARPARRLQHGGGRVSPHRGGDLHGYRRAIRDPSRTGRAQDDPRHSLSWS